jgi:hypothetical protein
MQTIPVNIERKGRPRGAYLFRHEGRLKAGMLFLAALFFLGPTLAIINGQHALVTDPYSVPYGGLWIYLGVVAGWFTLIVLSDRLRMLSKVNFDEPVQEAVHFDKAESKAAFIDCTTSYMAKTGFDDKNLAIVRFNWQYSGDMIWHYLSLRGFAASYRNLHYAKQYRSIRDKAEGLQAQMDSLTQQGKNVPQDLTEEHTAAKALCDKYNAKMQGWATERKRIAAEMRQALRDYGIITSDERSHLIERDIDLEVDLVVKDAASLHHQINEQLKTVPPMADRIWRKRYWWIEWGQKWAWWLCRYGWILLVVAYAKSWL